MKGFALLTLKEVTFAAIIAAGMIVISLVAVPLVVAIPVPGIRNLVVAPFFGLLLSLALMRIKNHITVTFVSFLTGAVQLFIGPVIFIFLVASGMATDIIRYLFWRKAEAPRHAIFAAGFYMAVMVPFGAFFGALMAGETPLAALLKAPLFILGAAAVCFCLGALGAYLGVKIAREFKSISMFK